MSAVPPSAATSSMRSAPPAGTDAGRGGLTPVTRGHVHGEAALDAYVAALIALDRIEDAAAIERFRPL